MSSTDIKDDNFTLFILKLLDNSELLNNKLLYSNREITGGKNSV